MNNATRCNDCGDELPADAPGGLCPKCLIEQGFQTAGETGVEGAEDCGVTVGAVEESAGRYTHLGEHGKGGMGRVLIVHDEHLERDIALKELLPASPTSTDGEPSPVRQSMDVVGRFLREAKVTGRLEHPSITPVYELGRRKDGTLYYTMKLVRGKTLSQAIKEAGSLEERLRLLPHFVDLCHAIAYAHSKGVIHRDIKPSNVMVGEFGETVVIDWGLAKVRKEQDVSGVGMRETILAMRTGSEKDLANTAYGEAMGTPVYMPPEQAQGLVDKVDERSDVYSLGAVLYEILTGQPPYRGATLQEILAKVTGETPRSIRSTEPHAPKQLARICRKAMAKDREKRYDSAMRLADAVQNWVPQKKPSKFRHAVGVAVLTVTVVAVAVVAVANRLAGTALAQERERTTAQHPIVTIPDLLAVEHEKTTSATDAARALSPVGFLHSVGQIYPSVRPSSSELWRLLQDTPQIDEEGESRIRELVGQQRDLIETLKQVGALPPSSPSEFFHRRSRYDEPIEFLEPDAFATWACASLLAADAYLACRDGRPDEALEICASMLNLGNHARVIPLFHVQSGFGKDISRVVAKTVASISTVGLFSKEAVNAFESALEGAVMRGGLVWSLEVERLIHLNQLGLVRQGKAAQLPCFTSPTSPGRLETLVFWLLSSPRLGFLLDRFELMYLQVTNRYLELAKRPFYEVSGDLELWFQRHDVLVANYWRYPSRAIASWLTYQIIQQTEHEVHVAAARVALALGQYKRQHGHYPEDLGGLVPGYLAELPVDPFSGEALIYRQEGGGYVLYSVGENMKDDGGQSDSGKYYLTRFGDIAWHVKS